MVEPKAAASHLYRALRMADRGTVQRRVLPRVCLNGSEFRSLSEPDGGLGGQSSRFNRSSFPFWCLTSCVALPVLSVVKVIWIGLMVAKKSWSV